MEKLVKRRELAIPRPAPAGKKITYFFLISYTFPANSPGCQGGLSAAYGSTKAALNYFAKAINRQEASNGIRINILSPGVVVTQALTPFVNVQKTGKFEIDESL